MRSLAALLLPTACLLAASLATGHRTEAQETQDLRVAKVRTNQEGASFRPPTSKGEWLQRREEIRRRILVSTGLYPLPEKTPLSPRIYGKLERPGYTVEKVVLETLPGFYLSGNLYRPANNTAKAPVILNPHGHWNVGRYQEDIQARCIGQARMGAVAFSYDMVGYADSKAFGHTFGDDELNALGMNLNGLQLWNSIRALDWVLTLPDVDPTRIAVTGESGGGTQTFELCAVDDRPTVAAPVCMVSHHFQGGCLCENAPNLRVGTDNVEFAACFAPKPQLLVGATGDWTSQIMERGVPELRATYRLFGQEQNLLAVVHQADHNYNQASRESVYAFLKRHLWASTDTEPVKEAEYKPEPENVISTWDAEHPRPATALDPARMKALLKTVVERQVASWAPDNAAQWAKSRAVVKDALQTLLDCQLPATADLLTYLGNQSVLGPGYRRTTFRVARKGIGDRVTGIQFLPAKGKPAGATVLVHPGGSAAVTAADSPYASLINGLTEAGQAVICPDVLLGGQAETIRKRQAGPYYSTYNRTILADRVQDLLTAVSYGRTHAGSVNLVGLEGAGPWVLLARPHAGDIKRTVADAQGWDWPATFPLTDEMALPGALRYGGMKVIASLSAPSPLFLHQRKKGEKSLDASWVEKAYAVQNSKNLKLTDSPAAEGDILVFLTGRS